MHPTPESETRRLLQLALDICEEVPGGASDFLKIAVFHRLCLETDLAKPLPAAEAHGEAH